MKLLSRNFFGEKAAGKDASHDAVCGEVVLNLGMRRNASSWPLR